MPPSDDSTHGTPPPTAAEAEYIKILESADFQELKRRYRTWVLPVALGALVWYLSYVLLSAYAHDFMSTSVIGNVNLGFVLGFAQFLTTFAITTAYVRYSSQVLDPLSARIRASVEGKDLN